jgi:hypothetical protein
MTTTESSCSHFISYLCVYIGNNVLLNDKLKFQALKTCFLGMRRGGRGSPRGPPRSVPTAEELDAELDAYVNKVK